MAWCSTTTTRTATGGIFRAFGTGIGRWTMDAATEPDGHKRPETFGRSGKNHCRPWARVPNSDPYRFPTNPWAWTKRHTGGNSTGREAPIQCNFRRVREHQEGALPWHWQCNVSLWQKVKEFKEIPCFFYRFSSECVTVYEFRPAGVRLEGSTDDFTEGLIKVPITCQCRLRRKIGNGLLSNL